MCQHRSYVVTEDHKVLSLPNNDHHTNIRQEHKIREDGFYGSENASTPIEFFPVDDLFNPERWRFSFDESRPAWWKKSHQEKVFDRLLSDFNRYNVADSTYIFPGNLDLSSLRGLPQNTTIIADGYILLDGIQELDHTTTIIAKHGPLIMRRLGRVYGKANLLADEVVAEPGVLRQLGLPMSRQYNEEEPLFPHYYRQMANSQVTLLKPPYAPFPI